MILTDASLSVDEARTYCKECVTLPAELCAVFRVDEVQGGLGNTVGHSGGVSGLLNEFEIAPTSRDVDNLLLGTLFD